MKFYYSHRWNEWLVSSRNWKIDNKAKWWNDTLSVLDNGSTSSGSEYRYRRELPWHYKRVQVANIPAKLQRIADEWEAQGRRHSVKTLAEVGV